MITIDAASDPWLRAALPPRDARRRLLKVLSKLPSAVVDTDITLEQFSDTGFGHKFLGQDGQATHFMANKGQPQRGAYAAGIDKVFGPAERAVQLFNEMADDSDLSTRTASRVDDVSRGLGAAVHAVQDSFSPTHVQRDQRGDIMRIQAWRDQLGKDHNAGDRSWQDGGGNLTKLGRLCMEATILLLQYFVLRVVNKDADAERCRRKLMKVYLHPADPSRSGWSP